MNGPSSLNCPLCGNSALHFFLYCVSCANSLEWLFRCTDCHNYQDSSWLACAWCGSFVNSGRLSGISSDPITLNPNSPHELTRAKETDTGIANPTEESALDGQSANFHLDVPIHRTGSSEVETTASTSDNEKKPSNHNANDEILSQSEVKDLRNVDDLYETANLHRQAQDFEKAIGDYIEIIKLDPRFASAFYLSLIHI